MRTIALSIFSLFIAVTTGFSQEMTIGNSDVLVLKGPYLGQKPPGVIPEVFAPGIISTMEGFEYAISFHPSGNELLLSKRVPENIYENNRILSMKYEDGIWSELSLTSFAGNYKAGEPIFTPDGKHIIFQSTRPISGATESKFDAWIVEYSKDVSEPQLLPEPFKYPKFLMYISSTLDNKIYFTSEGGIWSAEKTEFGYKEAIKLGGDINSPIEGVHPFIAPDESYLIFDARDRSDGFGASDLYISYKMADGSWTKSINLGDKINSSLEEICASVSGDGKYLFFHSMRKGNGDIYWVDAKILEELRPKN